MITREHGAGLGPRSDRRGEATNPHPTLTLTLALTLTLTLTLTPTLTPTLTLTLTRRGEGSTRAADAAEAAISSPLLDLPLRRAQATTTLP